MEHQGAHALPWVAVAHTAVAQRGLAAHAGNDDRAAATHDGGGGREEMRRAWGGLRNAKVRPVGTKEVCRWRNDSGHGALWAAMASTRLRERGTERE